MTAGWRGVKSNDGPASERVATFGIYLRAQRRAAVARCSQGCRVDAWSGIPLILVDESAEDARSSLGLLAWEPVEDRYGRRTTATVVFDAVTPSFFSSRRYGDSPSTGSPSPGGRYVPGLFGKGGTTWVSQLRALPPSGTAPCRRRHLAVTTEAAEGPIDLSPLRRVEPENSCEPGDLGLSTLIVPARMWELRSNSVGTGHPPAPSPFWWMGFRR